jgi:T4 RnlA family RNA ligase
MIPTYNDCLEIIDNNPDMYFYERKYIIDSYNVSIFGYRYAKYNNFILPIIDKPHINALELKGLTYIFDDNGEYKHFLLLDKFWEIDQYEHCKYDFYKDKKIKNVTVKEDGFLISFLQLPNGKILSFAKNGLDSDVNNEANEYLDKPHYKKFIEYCLDNDYQPIFELVGRNLHKKYDNKDLILLKIRNNNTGGYLDVSDFDTGDITVVENVEKTLDELLDISNKISNLEGWVVHFDNGVQLKIKTKWWIELKNEKDK